MRQYLDLVERILRDGEYHQNRTGVATFNIFGAMMQFDLRQGFPLLTTKKVLFDTVVDELLWFIRGGHNNRDADAPKKIWEQWGDQETGELGRIYGVQWREWLGWVESVPAGDDALFPNMQKTYPHHVRYDQLRLAIAQVKKLPNSRRNIVSAWNVAELEQGQISFPPCHVMFQLRVMGDDQLSGLGNQRRLDLAMYQRSCDMALGVPFNIASYALLLTLIANECGLTPGMFTHFLADAHVYENHVEGLRRQLERKPYPLPKLDLVVDNADPRGVPVVRIAKHDIILRGYQHHPFIRFEVAV